MKRFPSYKVVSEYENRLQKENIPVTIPVKLLINYMIQVIRRFEPTCSLNDIVYIKQEFYFNPRIRYLNFSEEFLMSIIEKYHNIFDYKYMRKGDKIIGVYKTTPTIWDYESRGLNLSHYDCYGDYHNILKRFKMKAHEYRNANSIYNRIGQILHTRFDYDIQVIKYGSILIRNATVNGDCDILLKFPENFHLNYIDDEFDYIKSILKEYGYQYISEWKTISGTRVLRFKDYNSDFTIDIGHYVEILVSKTNLIGAYQNLHPDIYEAILLIKIWADRRKLNNPSSTHVISSYCHVLMFITYLIMIKAIPNLRIMSPKIDLWEARKIDYYLVMDSFKRSEPDKVCSKYAEPVYGGFNYIPIYYHEGLDIKLGCNWSIKEAIQGYFHFMGYKFNYRTWDISIYHGGIVSSSGNFDLIDSNTKLLRVRHPFKPDQIESKSALPWCVDGLKWEFMRGYQLLRDNDWNELYHEATPPSAEEVYSHNMYTYISLY